MVVNKMCVYRERGLRWICCRMRKDDEVQQCLLNGLCLILLLLVPPFLWTTSSVNRPDADGGMVVEARFYNKIRIEIRSQISPFAVYSAASVVTVSFSASISSCVSSAPPRIVLLRKVKTDGSL